MNKRSAFIAFWSGIVLMLAGLLTHYIQLTPFIFLFDMPWPRLVHSLVLLLLGFALSIVGLWQRRTKVNGAVLLVLLTLTGWFLTTTIFVYDEESVQFTNGNTHLRGSLLVPRSEKQHAAVIIVHGTAPNNRTPYRILAEHFVRNGIATLIYDKRGFGASTGQLPYTYAELADDVKSAVSTLQQHPQIDAARIGLLGFSEGGFVGPLAAVHSEGVAFLAIVSGGGVSPAETVYYEMTTALKAEGFTGGEIEQALRLRQQLDDYFRTGDGGDTVWNAIQAATQASWFETAFEVAPDELPASLETIPLTRDYPTDLDFDPVPLLARLEIPLLFLFGEADMQIPVDESIQAIRSTLTDVGKTDFTIKTFADADHLILVNNQPAPNYLESLTAWIVAHAQ